MPNILAVGDPDDPRVEPYRNVRERDLVGRQEKFVAEGEVVLRALVGNRRFSAESVLVDARRLDGRLDALLAPLPDEVPVYAASRTVLDGIAGFHLHRGILAIGRRGHPRAADQVLAALPARATVVAALGIANHDNVGAIFRNAAALGAAAVLLDRTSCDPLYRKAIRVSVGAVLTLPWARGGSDADLLDALRRHGFAPLALTPAGAEDLPDVERPDRSALLLGAEGRGLPAAILAGARTVRIAMAEGFDSLNVATACAIALHHLAR